MNDSTTGAVRASAGSSQVTEKLQGVAGLDWIGPARVAGAILGSAAVLAVLIGLGLRPGLPGLHWTVHTTVLFFGMLWASAFGADMTAHASGAGVSAHAGIGSMPLTITILACAAGAVLFRRCTKHLTSAGAVFGFAARTALLTSIPPLVVSWILNADLGAMLHLFGNPQNLDVAGIPSGAVGNLTVGVSSWGSFFGALLMTLVVLTGATLTRNDLFDDEVPGRPTGLSFVRSLLVGPVVGFTALAVALIPAGAVAAVSLGLFHLASGDHTTLSWQEWTSLVAGGVAYAPNLGLVMLALGSAGHEALSAGTTVLNLSYGRVHGLAYWAGSETGINHGMWVAVVLAPAILAATAYSVVRFSSNQTVTEQRKRLGTWLVSVLVAVPVLFHVASIHAHASVTGVRSLMEQLGPIEGAIGAGLIGDTASGHVVIAPTTGTVFLVFLYAALVSAVVAYATGLMTKESLTGPRGVLAYQPVGHASPQESEPGPARYHVGDVVNGHRFTGSEWVPETPAGG